MNPIDASGMKQYMIHEVMRDALAEQFVACQVKLTDRSPTKRRSYAKLKQKQMVAGLNPLRDPKGLFMDTR